MFDSMNGIITGGLGVGLPACCNLITMRFHLGKRCHIDVIPPVIPPVHIQEPGGGSYPMAPGSAKNIFQPVGQPRIPIGANPPFYVPVSDKLGDKAGQFKFTVVWDNKEVIKDYVLPNRSGRIVINLLQITDVTRDKIKIMSTNIRKITNNIKLIFHKYTKIK